MGKTSLVWLSALAAMNIAALLITETLPAVAQPTPIAQRLPKKPHDTACFTATLSHPVAMDIEDWSEGKVKMEPVPDQFEKTGKQMTRPVPVLLQDRNITSLVMQISAEDLNPSEPFNFIMRANINGRKRPFYAAGICAHPNDAAGKTDENRLGCYIECDGGSVSVSYVPDTASIAVLFDRGGLRMSPGCSDQSGPSYRVKSAADTTTFRLTPVTTQLCRPLRAWLKQQ